MITSVTMTQTTDTIMIGDVSLVHANPYSHRGEGFAYVSRRLGLEQNGGREWLERITEDISRRVGMACMQASLLRWKRPSLTFGSGELRQPADPSRNTSLVAKVLAGSINNLSTPTERAVSDGVVRIQEQSGGFIGFRILHEGMQQDRETINSHLANGESIGFRHKMLIATDHLTIARPAGYETEAEHADQVSEIIEAMKANPIHELIFSNVEVAYWT